MTLLHCCADAINKKIWVWEVGKIHKALLLSPLDFIISRKFITSKSYFIFWVVLGVVLGAPATGVLRALLPSFVPGNSSWGALQTSHWTKVMPHHASQNAHIQQGTKWLRYIWEHKDGLTVVAGSIVAIFFWSQYWWYRRKLGVLSCQGYSMLSAWLCLLLDTNPSLRGYLLLIWCVSIRSGCVCLFRMPLNSTPRPLKCYKPHSNTDN